MSRKLAVCLAVAIAATSVIGDSAFAERKGRSERGKSAENSSPRGPAPKRREAEHSKRGPGRPHGGGWGDQFGPLHDRSPDLERVLDMILRR
jgi:hypothetical protein